MVAVLSFPNIYESTSHPSTETFDVALVTGDTVEFKAFQAAGTRGCSTEETEAFECTSDESIESRDDRDFSLRFSHSDDSGFLGLSCFLGKYSDEIASDASMNSWVDTGSKQSSFFDGAVADTSGFTVPIMNHVTERSQIRKDLKLNGDEDICGTGDFAGSQSKQLQYGASFSSQCGQEVQLDDDDTIISSDRSIKRRNESIENVSTLPQQLQSDPDNNVANSNSKGTACRFGIQPEFLEMKDKTAHVFPKVADEGIKGSKCCISSDQKRDTKSPKIKTNRVLPFSLFKRNKFLRNPYSTKKTTPCVNDEPTAKWSSHQVKPVVQPDDVPPVNVSTLISRCINSKDYERREIEISLAIPSSKHLVYDEIKIVTNDSLKKKSAVDEVQQQTTSLSRKEHDAAKDFSYEPLKAMGSHDFLNCPVSPISLLPSVQGRQIVTRKQSEKQLWQGMESCVIVSSEQAKISHSLPMRTGDLSSVRFTPIIIEGVEGADKAGDSGDEEICFEETKLVTPHVESHSVSSLAVGFKMSDDLSSGHDIRSMFTGKALCESKNIYSTCSADAKIIDSDNTLSTLSFSKSKQLESATFDISLKSPPLNTKYIHTLPEQHQTYAAHESAKLSGSVEALPIFSSLEQVTKALAKSLKDDKCISAQGLSEPSPKPELQVDMGLKPSLETSSSSTSTTQTRERVSVFSDTADKESHRKSPPFCAVSHTLPSRRKNYEMQTSTAHLIQFENAIDVGSVGNTPLETSQSSVSTAAIPEEVSAISDRVELGTFDYNHRSLSGQKYQPPTLGNLNTKCDSLAAIHRNPLTFCTTTHPSSSGSEKSQKQTSSIAHSVNNMDECSINNAQKTDMSFSSLVTNNGAIQPFADTLTCQTENRELQESKNFDVKNSDRLGMLTKLESALNMGIIANVTGKERDHLCMPYCSHSPSKVDTVSCSTESNRTLNTESSAEDVPSFISFIEDKFGLNFKMEIEEEEKLPKIKENVSHVLDERTIPQHVPKKNDVIELGHRFTSVNASNVHVCSHQSTTVKMKGFMQKGFMQKAFLKLRDSFQVFKLDYLSSSPQNPRKMQILNKFNRMKRQTRTDENAVSTLILRPSFITEIFNEINEEQQLKQQDASSKSNADDLPEEFMTSLLELLANELVNKEQHRTYD